MVRRQLGKASARLCRAASAGRVPRSLLQAGARLIGELIDVDDAGLGELHDETREFAGARVIRPEVEMSDNGIERRGHCAQRIGVELRFSAKRHWTEIPVRTVFPPPVSSNQRLPKGRAGPPLQRGSISAARRQRRRPRARSAFHLLPAGPWNAHLGKPVSLELFYRPEGSKGRLSDF